MTGRLASGLLSVVVVGVLAVPVQAQPSSEEVQANQAKAAELVQKGIQLQTKHDIDGAVALYRQAYCLIPEPVLVYNMGTAYQEGNKPTDAISYFRLYLKIAPGGDLAQEAKNAIKMLQQAGAKGGETATIKCEAKQPACLDGSQPVNGTCKGMAAPPKTCGEGEELRGGECVAVVTGGEIRDTPPSGPKQPRTLLYAGIGTAGAGAIALVAGIAYGIKAGNASDALTNNMGMWTPELLAKEQEGKDAERNQIIFTVAGGVLVAGGAALIVLHMRKKDGGTETSAWVPYVTGDQAGIAFSGSY
jgi:hypothetical protein